MRTHSATYEVTDIRRWLQKACTWADQYPYFIHLNNQGVNFPEGGYPILLGAASSEIRSNARGPFESLKASVDATGDWHLGFMGYDCKNHTEDLSSTNQPLTDLPEYHFFIPEILIRIDGNMIKIESNESCDPIFRAINASRTPGFEISTSPVLRCDTDLATYIKNVNIIREHILDGDIYELNYCIAPQLEHVGVSPIATFFELSRSSPAPFSCLVKHKDKYLVAASPERFIRKRGPSLISQPIKGTIRRGKTPAEDHALRDYLLHDEKERAENMMIVDLVRNDLARSSLPGSVKVREMFGIYPFKQLSQMISTVEGTIRPDTHYIDAIRNAFPMGSMTGAPKVKAMELIDQYESFKRGIYSGTVGVIDTSGDFDFNVVIRSLIMDTGNSRASLPVGSAVTYDSDPLREYDECWLKASGILRTFGIETPASETANF